MTWHAEVIMLTLRRFEAGRSYEARDKFASTATAHILGGNRAFICGFLNDGTRGPISRQDWVELRALLREKHGIEKIETERHEERKDYDTGPAPLA